jgi:putative membrane protein
LVDPRSAAVVTLVTAVFLTVLITAALRARRRVNRWQLAMFIGGWLVLALALISPLHELAEERLSAHMLQHELLILLAAPLLALARPHMLLLSWVQINQRRRAARWMSRARLSMPAAWIIHTAALWIWHFPWLYDASVNQPMVHAAQHLSFFATAMLFWWSVLARRSNYGAAAIYVFLTAMHSGLLGVMLFLSPRLWYGSYAGRPGALEDQQLAGLIMWVPGGVALAITAMFLLWRWLNDLENRATARERLAIVTSHGSRALGLLAILTVAAFTLPACNDAKATAVALTGGNPDRGKDHIRKYGCASCHTIPGIVGADAVVGPPLTAIANRAYVAGHPNSPQHMIDWIRHPQNIRAPTPMPDMGVTEHDARDIAAYLYTLR